MPDILTTWNEATDRRRFLLHDPAPQPLIAFVETAVAIGLDADGAVGPRTLAALAA
jgi:hypothetical protein